MCTHSAAMQLVNNGGGAKGRHSVAGPSGGPRLISPVTVKRDPQKYLLVDVREEAEIAGGNVPAALEGAVMADNMGMFLKAAHDGHHNHMKQSGRPVVCYCNSGFRSGIVAKAMEDMGFDVYSMDLGLKGWGNPAALNFESVIVVMTESDVEKITLALSMANASLFQGQTVAVICFGEGVALMNKKKSTRKDMKSPDPFKPVETLLSNFRTGGGVVFCCNTCVKSRGWDFKEDLEDFVEFVQAPDVARMVGAAKMSMQFM